MLAATMGEWDWIGMAQAEAHGLRWIATINPHCGDKPVGAPTEQAPVVQTEPQEGRDDEQEEKEEDVLERAEVQAALAKALNMAEKCSEKSRCIGSGKRTAEEDAEVTGLRIRVRALLQDDSESESEESPPVAARSQQAGGSREGAATSPLGAATSQPELEVATMPQATKYMDEKQFHSITERKNSSNLVHDCCYDSQKRSTG